MGSARVRRVGGRVSVGGAALEARGGIVGGAIALGGAAAHAALSQGLPAPAHLAALRLAALELRLEYMGAPALLARLSRLRAAARDSWQPPRHTAAARYTHTNSAVVTKCP